MAQTQSTEEILEATHATVTCHQGDQQWTLFTGPKPEAIKAADALFDLLTLTRATEFTLSIRFHGHHG